MKAYCVKCKKKVEINSAKITKLKNGRNAVKGLCSKCGIRVFKFVK